jgi:hypothetical protein
MKATEIGSVTCVGFRDCEDGKPNERGNCFDLKVDGIYRRVVNFNHENLEELMRQGLTLPLEVELLTPGAVVIMDPRIGERWYSTEFCEICCPKAHWPIPQLQRRTREIARGRIEELPPKNNSGWGSTICHFGIKAEFE